MTPTYQQIDDEIAKDSDSINLTLLSFWIKRAGDSDDQMTTVALRLYREASAARFYRDRYREFDKLARTLPEPFKTRAFDILANGQIAPWVDTVLGEEENV